MKRKTFRSLFLLFSCFLPLAILLLLLEANARSRPVHEEKISDGTMITVLPEDAIKALTNPSFLSRVEADKIMDNNEPVLGLADPATGQAKAYSLWHLDAHEIVNDRLGDRPVAVTW